MPLDTSFTNEQRRVTEDNMRLFGWRVWRHVIVLFTFGDTLGDKTIEQHLESEGKPLRWLIEKCENRYHVLDNMRTAEDQIIELLQKMEEMVAGNSSFYHSAHPETDDPQPEEDKSTENKDDNTTKKITEQLSIKWDRSNWDKYRSLSGSYSIGLPPNVSDSEQKSDSSEGDKEQEHQHDDDQFKAYFVASKGDAASGPMNRWLELLEREWRRREAAMELAAGRHFYKDGNAASEPDTDQLLKARQKVTQWLTSGYGTDPGTAISSDNSDEEEIPTEDYRQTVESHATED